jgi:LuxR family transcriptional regulator, transcriptional regulator of spore coat protein
LAHVNDWSLVHLTLDEWRTLAFKPLFIYKTQPDGGRTLWISAIDDREVVLSFDWHVLEIGVLVRGQDLQTNAFLRDDAGPLSEPGHYLQAAITVHALEWHRAVTQKALRGFDTAQAFVDVSTNPSPVRPDVWITTQSPQPEMSKREVEVLHWTRCGKSAHEVGLILGISRSTVEKHLSRAATKYGCSGKQAAVLAAIRAGLIKP